jgi:SAM-dependent methyltransferase
LCRATAAAAWATVSYGSALFHVGGQNTCPRTFRALPGEELSSSDEVEAGQRVYTPLVLWGYDLLVLGFSNRFVWRCRSSRMLERYNAYVGERHLDVGVGTGWFLDHCNWPVETPQITLLDLNENSLSVASKRIRRYAPATIQANVLDPVDLGDVRFDSIGANYLFHCLPGELESKAATVASSLRPYLASDGVLFGSTILGRGVRHNLLGRRLMRLYNRKGIFSNLEDDQRGLERGLASKLTRIELDVVGAVALFAGRL